MLWFAAGKTADSGHEEIPETCRDHHLFGGTPVGRRHVRSLVLLYFAARSRVRKLSRDGELCQRSLFLSPPERRLHGLSRSERGHKASPYPGSSDGKTAGSDPSARR